LLQEDRSGNLNDRQLILIVDDLVDNLFLLQAVLEAEGFKVDKLFYF
jgi:CheY-like chemotaxis protein